MPQEGFKRKLTAILSADVVGYSRLMRDNEEATVRDLASHRVLITEIIKQHNGRVIDSPGDNILAEFASVVDAVNSAIKIQEEINNSNAGIPEDRRMEFRIGLNLGDVIEEEERIYGDGVNIAARVEGLAAARGISISGTVYEHIKDKLSLGYHYLGEQEVKNISEPVRVYSLLTQPEDAGKLIGEKKKRAKLKWAIATVIVLVVFIFAILGGLYWKYFHLPDLADIDPEIKTAFDLPKGPSIAVLPFDNMTGDPEQDYLIDGLTEAIITGLSGCPRIFVIARNSSFTYKGNPVKVQQVARELGVQYIVEGSVQMTKDRVRIMVQLIEANAGHHIWAEKFDKPLKNIFALQDEITLKIINALEVKLTEGEQARLRVKGVTNIEAYMKGLKGLEYLRRQNKESNVLARQEAEEAIVLLPGNSRLYTLLAATYIMDLWLDPTKSQIITFAQATDSIKKAISLDTNNSDAYMVLSDIYLLRRQHEQAIIAAERAVGLNPNGADAYCQLAWIIYNSGKRAEAIDLFKKAIRLNPFPPNYYMTMLGVAYISVEQYEEAIDALKKAAHLEPNDLFAHVHLAAAYIKTGKEEDAHKHAANVLRIDPKFSLDDYEKILPDINRTYVKDYIASLQKAGLK
jgi:adenylate cyclase